MLKIKRKTERGSGVTMERNMDVPEMPLSYRCMGWRKKVMPVAFTMPATVRARKLKMFSFSFCKVLMVGYLGKLFVLFGVLF